MTILLLGLIAWFPGPAAAEEVRAGDRCLAFQKDLTDPSLREVSSRHAVFPAGAARTTYLSGSRKVSQQTFLLGGLEKAAQATVTCTGTCTGGCGVSGCDVTSSLGCSACECTGGTCTCSCTKKSTVVSETRRD